MDRSVALIYKRPFIAVANYVRGITRFESIAELLGIRNKLINSLENIDVSDEKLFDNIDYEKVDSILSREKQRSKKWLTEALYVPVKKERSFCELDALKAHIEDIDYIASRNGYRISLVEQHGVNVDTRFDAAEQRIANVEKHGVNVDTRFDAAEQRIANVEKHGVNVDARFDAAEQRIANVEKHGADVDARFDTAEQRIANVEKHGADVDTRFEILYSMILKTQHRTLYGACAWLLNKIIRRE